MENANIIIEYLNGELNDDQAQDFRSRLESDPSFREEYEMMKDMHIHMQHRKYEGQYLAEIETLNQKHFEASGKYGIDIKKWIILLLALGALALAIWYFQSSTKTDLYEAHADHFALYLVTKNDENTTALNAENSFNEENFAEAINAITAYLKQNNQDTKAQLALGISYLETNDVDNALKIFKLIGSGTSTLKDYGLWYEALAYVKMKQYDEAKVVLERSELTDPLLITKKNSLLQELRN